MAWISVHDHVLSGKLRTLSKEIGCSQNEALGMLVRFWIWGINNAGKEGCIEGADRDDISDILNVGLCGEIDPRVAVDALIETGWIDEENDRLYIHDWEEWQEQWYKAIEKRKKNADRKRKQRSLKNDDIQEETKRPSPVIEVGKEKKEDKKSAPLYAKSFEEFWSIYPRKVGKGEAYKKYQARLNDGWSEEELLEASRKYSERVMKERTEEKYIKHAKTFLSENTPFADFIPKKSQKNIAQINEDDPFGEWRRG